jgi:transposase InsO family protein
MERDIKRLREWCIRRKNDGWSVKDICSHARIPRRTFYFWWNKYRDGGLPALQPKSRRPKTIHTTPECIVNEVMALRKKRGWNEKVIARHVGIGHTTVYKILSANNLINPIGERKQRTYTSFSRKRPDSLWQTDIKYHDGLFLIAYIDDCSRYILDAILMKKATAISIVNHLKQLFEYRIPRQILTDHGIQYWTRHGKSEFDDVCRHYNVEHIMGGIGKPTTQGKIERFFRTFNTYYPRFSSMDEFLYNYNHVMLHSAIGYRTPGSVYFDMCNMW